MPGFSHYIPDATPYSLEYVDWEALWQQGYRGIVVDMDNTLIPWGRKPCVTHSAKEWVMQVRALGFAVCLVSNGQAKRVEPVAQLLGLLCIPMAGKPKPQSYQRAAAMMGLSIARCVSVGDQWLTDTVGAKRAGMRAYLVRRLAKREFIGTRFNRLIEALALRIMGVRRAQLEKVV